MTCKLETQLTAAGWNHKRAATNLVMLLTGHTSCRFTSGLSALTVRYRYHKSIQTVSEGWTLRGGFASRARAFLKGLVWRETGACQ